VTDLDAINRVVEAAVMSWNLPERVRRLALPGYRYCDLDLDHLDIVVAEDPRGRLVGIAAWEPAAAKDAPAGQRALLLHGIHVHPDRHRQGIGRRLFGTAEAALREQHFDGLLVKAQADASGFFLALAMTRLPVEEPARQYPNRFWKTAQQL
jgi:GNAT superfamily N-acetyltransferase